MSGLFEDDKNVRRTPSAPKLKAVSNQDAAKKVLSVSKIIGAPQESKATKSILDKYDSTNKTSIAQSASFDGNFDYSKVNLQKAEKKVKSEAKSAEGIIVPAIDYIGE